MERARDRFLNRPLLAYDMVQHGKLTFNTLTGSFDLRLERPGHHAERRRSRRAAGRSFQAPRRRSAATGLRTGRTREPAHEQLRRGAGKPRRRAWRGQCLPDLPALSRLGHSRTALGRFRQGEPDAGRARPSPSSRRHGADTTEYEDLAAWLRLKGIKDLGPDPSAIVVGADSHGLVPATGTVGENQSRSNTPPA